MAEKKYKHPFRSIMDLHDYNDDEVNTLPSLTDPSADEPIEKLVAKLIRGEILNMGSPGYDDLQPGVSDSEAFDGLSPSSRDGFDLADIPPAVEAAREALQSLKNEQKAPKEPLAPKEATPTAAPAAEAPKALAGPAEGVK